LEVKDLQFNIYQQPLWEQALSFNLSSGERLGVYGPNGSGKSTLLRLLLGQIAVETNHLWRKPMGVFYLDQQYAGLQTNQSILELVKTTADPAFNEAEIHTTLHQFLFPVASWAKAVISLSGGEKLRLQLCIQQLSRRFTDLVVLDEPANNLDIDNVEVLVKAINSYTGSLIVVSHQQDLFEQLGVEKRLHLPAGKLI
jgi:ATPase subunit of ABC transporter with duplicated ATPase domains